MPGMVSHELTTKIAFPTEASIRTITGLSKSTNAWRSFVALIEFPFVYSKLYDQIIRAFEDGAKEGHLDT